MTAIVFGFRKRRQMIGQKPSQWFYCGLCHFVFLSMVIQNTNQRGFSCLIQIGEFGSVFYCFLIISVSIICIGNIEQRGTSDFGIITVSKNLFMK